MDFILFFMRRLKPRARQRAKPTPPQKNPTVGSDYVKPGGSVNQT